MPETNKLYKDIASSLGVYGTIYADAGTTSTGNFSKAEFLTSGIIAGMTAAGITGSSNISSGTTFAAGSIFAGTITSIEVKTGSMLIYKKES